VNLAVAVSAIVLVKPMREAAIRAGGPAMGAVAPAK
jgi:hypothetical protein